MSREMANPQNSTETIIIYISRVLRKRPPFAPVISLPFVTHTSPRHPFVLRTIIIAWKLNDVPLLKRPSMKTFLCGSVYYSERFPVEMFICGDVSHVKFPLSRKYFRFEYLALRHSSGETFIFRNVLFETFVCRNVPL